MKPRERVFAALQHKIPDRVPRFETWIDASLEALGQTDPVSAYANLGQDCIQIPTINPKQSNAWRTGVDEWGRVWKNRTYVDGVVDTLEDLKKYTPPLEYIEAFYDEERIQGVRETYPDHCLIFGTHIGPFTAGYMAMGFSEFFFATGQRPGLCTQAPRIPHRMVPWDVSKSGAFWGRMCSFWGMIQGTAAGR
jgi:hypothetical protein